MSRIQKLITILKVPYYRNILVQTRVAASTEHTHVLKRLAQEQIKTIVDVGANRGQFAIASRHHFPKAKIISFEPLAEAAEVFQKIFGNDPNVTLHHCAIGSKNEETEIHISKADDSSSLLPIADLQDEIFPGTAERGIRKISVRKLDDLIKRADLQHPALLKLDVQGFEIEVFEGCGDLLLEFNYIYVECSFVELYQGQSLVHEVIDLLSGRGFNLIGVYNTTYDAEGLAVQGDFLFEKS